MKELKSLNLPTDQFAVMSSGVLAVRGLREARDLDLVVTRRLWVALSSKYPVEKHDKGYFISLDKNIEAVGGRVESQEKDFIQMEVQIKKADIIDGVRYVKLEDVIKFKKRLGRKKDIKDIALIDKYLKRRKK